MGMMNHERDDQHFHPALFLLTEPAEAQAQLNCVDAGIGRSKAGVGNVHEANLRAQVALGAQKMQADGAAGRKIDSRNSRGHLRVCEERPAANLEIGYDVAPRSKRPFERKRVHTHAVGRILLLNHDENRHRLDGILQAASEKPGPMRLRENQTVAQANIPNTVAQLAAVSAMASAGPNLDFMLAFDGTSLRAGNGNTQGEHKKEKSENCTSQRRVSSAKLDSWLRNWMHRRYKKMSGKANLFSGNHGHYRD